MHQRTNVMNQPSLSNWVVQVPLWPCGLGAGLWSEWPGINPRTVRYTLLPPFLKSEPPGSGHFQPRQGASTQVNQGYRCHQCDGSCREWSRVAHSIVQLLNHSAIKVPERPSPLHLAGSLHKEYKKCTYTKLTLSWRAWIIPCKLGLYNLSCQWTDHLE